MASVEEENAKMPASTTNVSMEHCDASSASTGLKDDDDDNNKKRKALGDDKESSSSSSSMTTTEKATPPPTATTTTTTAQANVDTNDNNHRREKRVRESPNRTEPQQPPQNNDNNGKNKKIVYYAIRQGSGLIPIDQPIIFFGYKEFDFFRKCCFNPTILARNGGATPSCSYQEFDTLVDALSYVEATADDHYLDYSLAAAARRRTTTGENNGGTVSTTTTTSNKRRKPNPSPSRAPARQQQEPATAQGAATTTTKATRQKRIVGQQQQQQKVVVAAATTATTTKTTRQQQKLEKAKAAAAAAAEAARKAEELRKSRWEEKFELLKQYKEEYGHCDVRTIIVGGSTTEEEEPNVELRNLIYWVNAQRKQLELFASEGPTSEKIKITSQERDRLLDLGFIVDAEDFRWNQMFDLLQEYTEKGGNCKKLVKYGEKHALEEKYKPLYWWSKKQLKLIAEFDNNNNNNNDDETTTKIPKHIQKMTAERWKRLEDLGFPTVKSKLLLEAQQAKYDKHFTIMIEKLKAYKEEHGTIVLPTKSNLQQWLAKRRRDYAGLQEGREANLKLEHVVAITSLGYSMAPTRPPAKNIRERVGEYVEFVKQHGRFPDRHSINPNEAVLDSGAQKWRIKRRLHAQGISKAGNHTYTEIPQDLIDALDSVNFRWEVKNFNSPRKRSPGLSWEERFELLKKYKEKHGHCEPPKRHPKLGLFAHKIRQNYKFMIENKKSNLTVERFRKLTEIGFRFKTAGVKEARKRWVDNDSSGYDTTSDEDNDDDDDDDDDNNDNEHGKSNKDDNDMRSDDNDGNDPGVAPAPNRKTRGRRRAPDNYMWG